MKKAVITGSTSMIGSALVRECLANGVRVYAVVRSGSPKIARLPEHENLILVEGSLENIDALPDAIPEECDTFYHIAWGHTGALRNASCELQADNILYSMKAVRAAEKTGCRRFIGAGSQAEYGPKDLDVIGPDTRTEPINPYGAAKLSACLMTKMLCSEIGMEWIWPRIFSTYGINDKPTSMISDSVRKMLAGEATHFTPAIHRWDYLFSRDAGRAFYLMGEKGVPGSIYCIGSGESRPLRLFIEEMAEACGVQPDGIGDIPYPKDRPVRNLCADIENLTRDTGFRPETSFRDGIRETVEFMRKQHG